MIDTICLLIPKDKIQFSDEVLGLELYSEIGQYKKFIRNPTKIEKETGNYFPKITSYEKGFFKSANIKIEFSASKLVYLNNLDELEDKDFSEVVEVLHERLKDMGVILTKSVIENASVSSVHYSKNILLKDGYTATHLISEMSKVNTKKNFDIAKTRFINDGHSLYFHTDSHQFVVYDKIADLKKEKKRAIDKDQTMYQKDLAVRLDKRTKDEIIRFEVRLNRKQKMNSVLKKLGYVKDLTFKNVFSSEISRKVVNDYWNTLILERSLGIFSLSLSPKDMLQTIFLLDKNIKPKQAIYLTGLFEVCKNENGIRQLRSILAKYIDDRTWYRVVKDMRYISELIAENSLRDWVKQIDDALEEYKAYKC